MNSLERFVEAQDAGGTYARALGELRAGRKTSHWMWFVFPQLAGLGRSAMAQRYAITSLDEAVAYVGHPVLGPRLRECSKAVLEARAPSAQVLLGGIDAQKLQSSMTLFARADPSQPIFPAVLQRWFAGAVDEVTDRLLAAAAAERPIFHLIDPAQWTVARSADQYEPESLRTEGFVHFSYADQLVATAIRYYAAAPELVALEIRPADLLVEVRVEDTHGTGVGFPHVYGAVPVAAVRAVHRLVRAVSGEWTWESLR